MDLDVTGENISFAIVNESEIVLLMPLFVNKIKSRLFFLALEEYCLRARWGLVLKDNMTKKQIKNISDIFIRHIDCLIAKYYITSDFTTELPPLAELFTPREGVTQIDPLVYLGFSPKVRYTYVVDLSKSVDEIFKDCEETTRQAIRKLSDDDNYLMMKPMTEQRAGRKI
ncbi:hypothetical protein AGMMS49928_13940 [Spirochaetia bacterium]|nr:hypothetical protein AGMMS49928_13940 [Spirochaetia bacterium]